MSSECTINVDIDGFFAVSARYLGLCSMQTGTRYNRGRRHMNERTARTNPHAFAHHKRRQVHG
jgi:hypothetical protein